MIKLSKRLLSIASFVDSSKKLIDIGCDHALVDIYLAQKYSDIKIIASDINQNALSNAINNIKKYNLEQRIDTVISNGLKNINMEKIDTIIISGMGTTTITSILTKEKLDDVQNIIIQSNNDIDKLRKYVTSIGYYIDKEEIIKENNKFYIIIKFVKGYKKYSYKEYQYGPILLKIRSSLFNEYLLSIYSKNKDIYNKVPNHHIVYKLKLLKEIRKIKKILYK